MNLQIQWIVGFIDGVGQFRVNIIKNHSTNSGFQIIPEFEVTQNGHNIQILYALKSHFKCGVVKNSVDDLYIFHVKNYQHLHDNVIPFFEKHKLKTETRIDFEKFRYVVKYLVEKKHLTSEGFQEIYQYITDWKNFQTK